MGERIKCWYIKDFVGKIISLLSIIVQVVKTIWLLIELLNSSLFELPSHTMFPSHSQGIMYVMLMFKKYFTDYRSSNCSF